MKILQISCGFDYTSVYSNLFHELADKKIEQDVYNPQHYKFSPAKKRTLNNSFNLYSNRIIRSYDKFLYFTKIYRMKNDIELNFNLKNISLIHAHSLFSDGGVAYELFKKHSIPYIVAVRNTDINKYYKYAFHLKSYANKILLNAKKIIFISPMCKYFLLQRVLKENICQQIEKKLTVIPNGIDSFWINNKNSPKKLLREKKLRILSVGTINKNKNPLNLVKACRKLQTNYGIAVNVTLVGKIKDKRYYNSIRQFSFVKHIDYTSKENLIQIYRKNDIYAMPSISETFGLVYVEAMSQGLPCIYTKGQGFDGQFEEGVVGFGVEANNIDDIAKKIMQVIELYDNISGNCIEQAKMFSWENISTEYLDIYNNID